MTQQLEDEPSEPREPQMVATVFTVVYGPARIPKGLAPAINPDAPVTSPLRGPWRVFRAHWHFTF